MAMNQNRKGSGIYQDDPESIYRPKDWDRVALPASDEVTYAEEQSFDQIWLWAIMGIELIVLLLPLIITGQSFGVIVLAASVMALTFALLGSLKLRTRMDSEGVHYRMSVFHWSERTIPWDEIDQIYVRKYSPVSEYGGWGIKRGPKGLAINVKGNYGIQVIKKNGKRILLGTQQPDEASAYLSQHLLLV